MVPPFFLDTFSRKRVRLGVAFVLLLLFSSLVLQSLGTARAQAPEKITVDKASAATGDYITITGTNMTDCEEGGACQIYLEQNNDFLTIGFAALDANMSFKWTGVIPHDGDFGDGATNQQNVATGPATIAAGGNPYHPETQSGTEITITAASKGPHVSWDAIDETNRLWYYYDVVIVKNLVSRSWFWGPKLLYAGYEPYKESPSGWRLVNYYDKARMEVNDYTNGAYENPYYVSNGLIVKEMVTNRIQLGDNTFQENTGSPDVLPAGDLTSANQTPPYRVYQSVLDTNDNDDGGLVNEYLSRTGEVDTNDSYNKYNVTVGHMVDQTGHYIASPFWTYLNTSGLVQEYYSQPKTVKLFNPLFSATGLPITEPYWTTTMVGGVNKDVLVQLFERRVLTYTPSNSPAYQVEMGNVGLQYFQWRYGQD